MGKKIGQDVQIRYVPCTDPEFAAKRKVARDQLIAILIRRIVTEVLAERRRSTDPSVIVAQRRG